MNLKNKRDTFLEQIWIEVAKLIGLVIFIGPLYLPVKAYFFETKQAEPLTRFDIGITVVGFFLWRGGKSVGTVANNLGVVIVNIIKKIGGLNNDN